ncbi:hypothetical protein CYMTET_43039 [Cymbomonas tetramitiformis]|uniref:SWI/SNF complex subunit SMARCC2 n=1 Tax=Cymbomonas tetramitiformis TaxID=36881 RepID=A0AAE0C4K4_9CHLO|nr:hypothetical protein CYMTET_43039 [Cymbomonas tetramitiformis]
MGVKRKCVKLRDYESDRMCRNFEAILPRLQKAFPQYKLDTKTLSQLTGLLLQFQEETLGKYAPEPKPLCKLPASLFTDYKPSGSLFIILAITYKFKQARDWRRFDFMARPKEALELLKTIREHLQKNKLLVFPKVYFESSVDTTAVERLKDKLTSERFGGSVASTRDEDGITHVLIGDSEDVKIETDEQYCRTLQVKGGQALVHWWYFPDSYDEWVSEDDIAGDAEDETKPDGPWIVYERWARDSVCFNEWMNPVDYVPDEEEAGHEDQGTAGKKRPADSEAGEESRKKPAVEGASGPSGRKSKRDDAVDPDVHLQLLAEENPQVGLPRLGRSGGLPDPSGPEVIAGKGKETQSIPLVQQQQVSEVHGTVALLATTSDGRAVGGTAPPPSLTTVVENLSHGQQPPPVGGAVNALSRSRATENGMESMPSNTATAPEDKKELTAGESEKLPEARSSKKELYRIPGHAAWFKWDSIHEIEKTECPEFFSGRAPSKNAKTYKEYRDFIINKFREHPERRLTFTECRQSLAGDANALQQVYSLLDDWNLINFFPEDRSQPPSATTESALPEISIGGPPDGPRIVSIADGEATKSLYNFHALNAPQASADAAAAAGLGGALPTSLVTRRNQYTDAINSACSSVEFHCNHCAKDCTSARYHCTKVPDQDLCCICFSSGFFPLGTSSADFIRIDNTATKETPTEESAWSDQETLLLLEALEMYGDSSWQQVAEHVGTKRPHQCMMHFVQLPIQDAFLEDMELGETTAQGDAPAGTGPPTEAASESPLCQLPADAVPFADAGNPVMAQVAFLAAMVGPKVAAAAAQAALAALTKDPMHADAAQKVLHAEASEQAEQLKKDAASDALPAQAEAGGGAVAAAADPETAQNAVRDKTVGEANAAPGENGGAEAAAGADVDMEDAENAAAAEELEADGASTGVELEQRSEEGGKVQDRAQETRQREDNSKMLDMAEGDEGVRLHRST